MRPLPHGALQGCCVLLLWTFTLLSGLHDCFNIDTRSPRIIKGSKAAQFGYTVQQHQAGGQKWLLVGAPLETNGQYQTGDVYKCPVSRRSRGSCSKLNLGRISLTNVSERKDRMRLGMSLASNPKDSSFVACGPLWSHECGSSYFSTGICSRVNASFKFSRTIAPAFQRCDNYMDIVIVLDGSNSIYPWTDVQEFLINILQKFHIGPGQIQVGVIQYGETVVHEFHLNDFRSVEEVVKAARKIDQRGGEETRTALGIKVALSKAFKQGGRRGAKKVMIVVTDGESHDSPDLQRVIEDSEDDDIIRYAIAVLGYYNRRGINPETFLNEIKYIASDPDDKHFFNVTDESALKDIVDALGNRIFSLEGTNQNETFGLQMSQAGFSSHVVEDGILVGAVGAYDWNGAVLKETRMGKVVPPKSSYQKEFPEELKNHAAYLGYMVTSVMSVSSGRLYVAGAPRFNHTGKVIIFSLTNNGNLTILHSLKGQQIGSYFGSEMTPVDINADGVTDHLLVAAPMYFGGGWERGKVYIYRMTEQLQFILDGALEVLDRGQNSRFGSALSPIPDLNGDQYSEVVVGAPLEDDHRGAIYVFFGQDNRIPQNYKQRIAGADLSPGLQYFGCSIHGKMDLNEDGLVDLTVGSIGAVVLLWSRSVVRIYANVRFEPSKINIFNKDCRRGGREVSCMSAIVCLNVTARTPILPTKEVALTYSTSIEERRYTPRAVLDDSEKHQSRNISLLPGMDSCEHVYFHVLESTDYVRPIVFTVEVGLQDLHVGPMLDDGWPTTVRTELPYWNGCDDDDHCIPDLVLQSQSDLLDSRQFCGQAVRSRAAICRQLSATRGSERMVEGTRRKMLMEVRLENRGENAYNAHLNISYSPNLRFSSLIVKDNSDIKIECRGEGRKRNERMCNISSPFMRSQAQVSFRLEFEFSHSVFLEHVRVMLEAASDGEEVNMADNYNDIYHQLRYEADLLFTRDSSPSRCEIKSERALEKPTSRRAPFNFTFQIQNLGYFPVRNLHLSIELPQVVKSKMPVLQISDFHIDQTDGARCIPPHNVTQGQDPPEDLSPQLNVSDSVPVPVQCSVSLPAYRGVTITIGGLLLLDSLSSLKFRSMEVVTTASIELSPSSPMFLLEDKPVRHIILEVRKEEDHRVPVWIIVGSTLGGLLLLALLILALWKLGFFQRQKRREEEQEANGKAAEER
ncbi:integrin alpha-11-like isoform X1 [Brienomyrus brachyistius]|uniref:integrin alpha-11-like isoform X1 n=1 Tax=Brienomyrus brachyistius TaxID=42636 RepID=UPI0020B2DC59|nr:integrin alpha-11-like isoform X1 [Brienomyrus brachyistius]